MFIVALVLSESCAVLHRVIGVVVIDDMNHVIFRNGQMSKVSDISCGVDQFRTPSGVAEVGTVVACVHQLFIVAVFVCDTDGVI